METRERSGPEKLLSADSLKKAINWRLHRKKKRPVTLWAARHKKKKKNPPGDQKADPKKKKKIHAESENSGAPCMR